MLKAIDAGLARMDFTQGMVNITRPLDPKQKAAISRGMKQGRSSFIQVESMDAKTHQTVCNADMDGGGMGAFKCALNEAEAVMRGERVPERQQYSVSPTSQSALRQFSAAEDEEQKERSHLPAGRNAWSKRPQIRNAAGTMITTHYNPVNSKGNCPDAPFRLLC